MAEEKPKAARKTETRGAWAVVDDGGQVLVVESSEIKAFRAAQSHRARVVFWPYGASRESVVATLQPVSS